MYIYIISRGCHALLVQMQPLILPLMLIEWRETLRVYIKFIFFYFISLEVRCCIHFDYFIALCIDLDTTWSLDPRRSFATCCCSCVNEFCIRNLLNLFEKLLEIARKQTKIFLINFQDFSSFFLNFKNPLKIIYMLIYEINECV